MLYHNFLFVIFLKENSKVVSIWTGSKFYENERIKEEQMKKRIVEQKRKVEIITEAQLQQGLVMVGCKWTLS